MEVMSGYKQTEVGTIPEDWSLDYIENLCHISTGKKNTEDRVDDGLYPFFVRSQTVVYINTYSYDGEAVLTAGDGVGTGKVFHYIKGKFDVHQRVYCISGFSKYINGYFFFLYFSSYFYYRIVQMTAKSSVDSVRREMIAKMLIPFPSYAEQKAIIEVLSDADALIESLEQLIAKKRQIKQAAMQELLLPKHKWATVKLGNLGIFLKGSGVRKDESMSGNLPCIRYGEIYTKHNNYIKCFHSWISKNIAATARRLVRGDLLFAGSGETKEDIGKCVAFIDNFEAYAGGDIVIFRPKNINSVFMGYYLNTSQINRQKASKGQGDAVVHITASALADIDVMIPPLEKQTSIAIIFSDMDAEINALESKLNKIRQIKQGMMHNLLTGRIRLI